jgi:tetratricopeptide (TPR) repeat protein
VQLERGDPLAALSAGERALPILERQLGATHHQLAVTLATLGRAYAQLGRRDAARGALERAIQIRLIAPVPDSEQLGALRAELAAIAGP